MALSSSFPFYLKNFLEVVLFLFSGVYLLSVPALLLQGRILYADSWVPFESSLCVFASVVLFGLSVYKVWRMVTK